MREKRKEKMKREEREKEYKTIKLLQHLSVLLQICNGTVVILYNF